MRERLKRDGRRRGSDGRGRESESVRERERRVI